MLSKNTAMQMNVWTEKIQIFESIDSCFNIPTCQTKLPYIKNSCTLLPTAFLFSPCYFMCIHYAELHEQTVLYEVECKM